jgi:TM2 domain-containing membrane protein YozV
MDFQNTNPYMTLSGITAEELNMLQQGNAGLTDEQKKHFFMIYASKRRTPQEVLIYTLLGFGCIAGVQRFMLGQIGMGLLYFFTGGLCLIGTVVDLVNHKKLTLEYNQKMAFESFNIAKFTY